jgi:3',5'-cyclic AMP phosphodiesterase CpdA
VIGDTNGGTVPAQIAARLVLDQPDFAIHTGDVVYPDGAEASYDDQFFRPLGPWLERGPVLPSIGNHDAQTDRASPLLANFVVPSNGVTADSRFYAFRQGNVLFVCLDVETSPYGDGSPQFAWLERTLFGTDAQWKVVYFHEPPFSSDHSNLVERLVLSPLLERYGVDVVFSGHAHLYERTVPIRLFADSGPGVLYVTEGGGGAVLSALHRIPESAYVATRFGYLLVDVDGKTLSITARDPDGTMFDRFSWDKEMAPGASRSTPQGTRRRPARSESKAPQ